MVTRRRLVLTIALAAAVATTIGTAAPAATDPAARKTAAGAKPRRRVLVFGGSGQLGSEIVRAMLGVGHDVTVFIRKTSSRERIEGLPISLVEGDATVEADVEHALRSRRFDVVVDALGRSGADVGFFAVSGPNIARWAAATGVRQIVLHSSVGVGASKDAYPAELYPRMERLFTAKKTGEDAVIASGVTYTIIRNAVLRDPPEGTPEHARLVTDQAVYGTVSRRGLARLTLGCVDEPDCADKVLHAIDDSLPVFR